MHLHQIKYQVIKPVTFGESKGIRIATRIGTYIFKKLEYFHSKKMKTCTGCRDKDREQQHLDTGKAKRFGKKSLEMKWARGMVGNDLLCDIFIISVIIRAGEANALFNIYN